MSSALSQTKTRQFSPLLYAAALCAALVSNIASAEVVQRVYGPTSHWSWSANVDRFEIDKKIAMEEGIETDYVAIGGAGEYYTQDSNMTLTLGLSIMFYDDNEAFSQRVHDYWDNGYYYESSDASGGMAFIEYGPKIHFGSDNKMFFTARGGLSGVFFSERSINGCSGCYSEDINVDGGAYGVLGVGRNLGYLAVSLQFQQYFGGDLDNGFRFRLSSAF